LKLSPNTLKVDRSILKRFKRHIGLCQTPPSHGGRKSRKKELEPLKREWEKKEGQMLEMIARRDQNIDALYAKNQELKKKIKLMGSKRRSILELRARAFLLTLKRFTHLPLSSLCNGRSFDLCYDNLWLCLE